MRYLRLLGIFANTELQFAMQYRFNLLLEVMQIVIVSGTSVAAVLVLFSYTTVMNGWTLPQMIVLLGVYYVVQGVEELVFQPSFERFMEHVRLGTLDFILLKPASGQFLISFRHFQTIQVVQVLVGMVIVAIGLGQLGAELTLGNALAFVVTLVSGFTLIYALLMVLSTLCFWVVRVDNILAIFWAFIDAGRFPIDIYPGWLRFTMSTVVPVGIAVTVPAQAIAGRLDPLGTVTTAVGALVAWLFASWFWHQGLRRYTGASA